MADAKTLILVIAFFAGSTLGILAALTRLALKALQIEDDHDHRDIPE